MSRQAELRVTHHELDRWGHDSKKGHENAAGKKCRASGSDDRQGKSRKSGRRRQAGICLYREPPEPQKSIAKHVDALAAKAVPDLKRAVKWGMAYYGVPDGWCFSSGAFVGHLKLMFIRGNELQPEPPVTPIRMGKATRGVELTAGGRARRRSGAFLDGAGRQETIHVTAAMKGGNRPPGGLGRVVS